MERGYLDTRRIDDGSTPFNGSPIFPPLRGIKVNARPSLWQPNSWENVLNGGWQIELWEGYGQSTDIELAWNPTTNSWAPASGALARTWTGIVEDCDLDSAPDMATITA